MSEHITIGFATKEECEKCCIESKEFGFNCIPSFIEPYGWVAELVGVDKQPSTSVIIRTTEEYLL